MATEGSIAVVERSPCDAPWCFWTDQRLSSRQELPIALDVETELVQDDRIVPRLALAAASDGHVHVVIHPSRLGDFLGLHRDASFVGHNVQFDFWVIHEHLSRTQHPAARVLWEACEQGRLYDTMILDMLLQLATGRYRRTPHARNDSNTKVYPGNLAEVAAEYTTLELTKEDPYRLRFGELVGMPEEDFPCVDRGFFEYAIRDVQVTYRLYPALAESACWMMLERGFNRSASRFEIRPDAVDQFGYLSETIQVKASVVLAHMFRRGVAVDQVGASGLTTELRNRVAELVHELRSDYPDALVINGDGQIKLTPQSRTPSLAGSRLASYLTLVAEEIRAAGHPFEVPISTGKKRCISQSVKAWQKYVRHHRFLQIWSEMKRIEKLLGFVSKLGVPTLHCQYSLLTRTGRTSCAEPRDRSIPGVNLQQMPKAPAFRRLFVPRSPSDRLFVADYAAIELRTLSAVCRAKFGRSRLAEVIEQGVDPHAFTAATIQKLPLDEFMALKETDPDRFRAARQSAKAINFGVPGGLGAQTLREYAEANYGVLMTEDEAAEFRKRLIAEVYPELNDIDGYLADDAMSGLARNLGTQETQLWAAFDRSGKRSRIAARGVEKVIAGTSTASAKYQAHVWRQLQRLAQPTAIGDNEVRQAITARRGSQELHDRLFRQSAATLTGRIRAGVGYTDSKNTPFQSLAADGAKLALWKLLYSGFDVYGFVHDEILVNLPPDAPEEAADSIRQIMEQSMASVLGGLPAVCEWTVGGCWQKP